MLYFYLDWQKTLQDSEVIDLYYVKQIYVNCQNKNVRARENSRRRAEILVSNLKKTTK